MFVIQPFVEYARIPETASIVEAKRRTRKKSAENRKVKEREREEKRERERERERDAGIHPTR